MDSPVFDGTASMDITDSPEKIFRSRKTEIN
jgi:hypothetical protein